MVTQKTINSLLRPLVVSGVYKDEKIALKDIIADYIQRKIEAYTSVIRQMESKYGKDFNSITEKLKGKATMKVEDDWIEWKAAILMNESWHKALKKLLRNAS
ncbi:MAG: hypothetical protein HY761_09490 [Candidatus Omnitrophica bacterium]|nr:hypothetical protein [Candidatus Omnitrophota bacterium]